MKTNNLFFKIILLIAFLVSSSNNLICRHDDRYEIRAKLSCMIQRNVNLILLLNKLGIKNNIFKRIKNLPEESCEINDFSKIIIPREFFENFSTKINIDYDRGCDRSKMLYLGGRVFFQK